MSRSPTARLQQLIHRRDKVLAVLHPPTAAHARIMERAGCEALFVGTGGVVGAYTGLADVGTATLSECVEIAGWIADSVTIPVIMDGDTGHGGIMAVRRMVKECIRRGIAGVRIDDQPIEGKRKTQSAGVEVVPLDLAIARYRAAVDMKNELDPDFVVMAQCYARDAANGGFEDALLRLKAYREEAGVDWVQLESPHSVDEIKAARAAVEGPFSFMKGKLGHYLGLDEHLALGVTIAWYPGFTHHVTWAALWDFMTDFSARGVAAWDDFVASRADRPYPIPEVPDAGRKRRQAAGAGAEVFVAMTRLWFRARSYGWGWTPVTVEGWLVMLAFLVAVGIVTAVFLYQVRHGADPGRSTLLFMLGIAILTGLLVAVAWLTGARPRWRWGE